jgi:hypothetical protein
MADMYEDFDDSEVEVSEREHGEMERVVCDFVLQREHPRQGGVNACLQQIDGGRYGAVAEFGSSTTSL